MNMEERVGRLEVKVDHIQSDITEVKTDVRELRAEVRAQGSEITALKIALEKFKGQLWVALAVLFVMQVLTMGGVPAAIARTFKWP